MCHFFFIVIISPKCPKWVYKKFMYYWTLGKMHYFCYDKTVVYEKDSPFVCSDHFNTVIT